MRNMLTIVCALAILAWAVPVFGATLPEHYYFTNASGDSLWMTANNWLAEDSTFGPPQDPTNPYGDNAWIGGGLTVELRSTTVATPKRLRPGISDGTAGTLKMYDGSHMNLSFGTANYAYIGRNGAGYGDGTVIQYGGTFTASGFGAGRYGAAGTWEIHGGLMDLTGSSGIGLGNGRSTTGGTGTMIQTGGLVSLVSTNDSDPGDIRIASADWVGDMHDQTGSYTISGGTLYARGDTGTTDGGGVIVGPLDSRDDNTNTKGTFHVISAWETGVDNIKIRSFEMYRVDHAMGNDATLICDIDGTAGIEKIVVEDAATFAGKLEVTTLGAGHAGTYTLATYTSATGDFDETDLPSGWTHNVGATELTVTVPEPATMTLLGLGGLGVLIRRKRR